jgi:hypothetical protein
MRGNGFSPFGDREGERMGIAVSVKGQGRNLRREYKTLRGAQAFAVKQLGECPAILDLEGYAFIGEYSDRLELTVTGCSLWDLFPVAKRQAEMDPFAGVPEPEPEPEPDQSAECPCVVVEDEGAIDSAREPGTADEGEREMEAVNDTMNEEASVVVHTDALSVRFNSGEKEQRLSLVELQELHTEKIGWTPSDNKNYLSSKLKKFFAGDLKDMKKKKTLQELREEYEEAFGKETSSDDRSYLLSRLKALRDGKISTGPRNYGEKRVPKPISLVKDCWEEMDRIVEESEEYPTRASFVLDALIMFAGANEYTDLLEKLEDHIPKSRRKPAEPAE